jgi:hypothetical protein
MEDADQASHPRLVGVTPVDQIVLHCTIASLIASVARLTNGEIETIAQAIYLSIDRYGREARDPTGALAADRESARRVVDELVAEAKRLLG